jgi:polar amino acid transport system substrate-binding protein
MKWFKSALPLFFVLLLSAACTHMRDGFPSSSTLNRIAKTGVLHVGTAADMPPLNMLDKNGVPMGLDVDLSKDMADAMGVKLSMVVKPFPELLPALRTGDVDMVISGMTITPERNMHAAFVGPYQVSGQALLTKFKSLVTAAGTAKLNSEAFAYAALENSASATLVANRMPKARLVIVKDRQTAVEKVLTNQVDAMIAEYPVCVMSLLRHPHEGLVSRVTPFTYEPLGIALPSGDAQMINWVTNFLHTLRESDRLIELKTRWFEDSSWLSRMKF